MGTGRYVVASLLVGVALLGCGSDGELGEQITPRDLAEARREAAQNARQAARIEALEEQVKEFSRESSRDEGTAASEIPSEESLPPVEAPSTESTTVTTFSDSMSLHGGWSAEIPIGDGWSGPLESTPNEGLYRTTFDGPGDLTVIVDYTPHEVPIFNGTAESRDYVTHPLYGTSERIVFSGGSIPTCQNTRCIDFLVPNGAGGGWGILAGGGDYEVAAEVADHIAATLRYYDY